METSSKTTDINESTKKDSLEIFVDSNYHRIRECYEYKTEYKSCNSLKGRFHQYFVDGKTADCTDLKTKWLSCDRCIYHQDLKACAEVIELENKRRQSRLKAHFANDTWTRRKEPPADWDQKLPNWAEIKMDGSFNDTYQDSFCVIS